MSRKIQPQATAAWADESVTDESAIRLEQSLTNTDGFLSEVKPILGRYRFDKSYKETQAANHETIEHLRKVDRQVKALKESIELIPAMAKCAHQAHLFKRYGVAEAMPATDRKLLDSLLKYEIGLIGAIADIEYSTSKTGRKTNMLEDGIIYDVFMLMKKYKIKKLRIDGIYELLAYFLNSNRIYTSIDPDTIRKAIIRRKKGMKHPPKR